MKHLILTVTAVAALVGAASSCTVEEPAAVVEQAETPASVTSASPTAEPSEAEVPQTAALGDTVSVGTWDIRVTDVLLDAAAPMSKANMFNEAAAGQYVLVSYEATYTGTERIGDSAVDLTWSFTTTDAKVNDQAYVVTPRDDAPTEARSGGTVERDVVFDLPPGLVQGGTLTVETYDEDFDLVYADFTV